MHDERLFRRTKYGIRFVPDIEMRENILERLHDEVGSCDFNSTNHFIRSRFWWPNMRQEVASFVNGCDIWQKTKPANWKEIETWCIDFAGPFPQTNVGNQNSIVAVEQMPKWPVARAIPAELFDSSGSWSFSRRKNHVIWSSTIHS